MRQRFLSALVVLACCVGAARSQQKVEDFPVPTDNPVRHQQVLELIEQNQPPRARKEDPNGLLLLRQLGEKVKAESDRMREAKDPSWPVEFDALSGYKKDATPAEIAGAQAMLKTYERMGVFDTLESIAKSQRAVRPKGEGLMLSLVIPEAGHARGLTRALMARFTVQLQAGDKQGAMRSHEQALALGRVLAHQPLMIDRQVAIAVVARANFTLRQAILEGRLDASMLEAAAGAMDRQLTGWPGARFILDAERLATVDAAEFVYVDENAPNAARLEAIGAMLINRVQAQDPGVLSLTKVRQNIDAYYSLATQAAEEPRRTRMDLQLVSGAGYKAGERSVLLRVVLPDVTRLIKAMDQWQLDVQATRTMIALERYHLRTKTYPATLRELVPRELDALPEERSQAWPLTYRREGSTYRLYSVGFDNNDNGGTTDPANPFKALTPDGVALDCTFR